MCTFEIFTPYSQHYAVIWKKLGYTLPILKVRIINTVTTGNHKVSVEGFCSFSTTPSTTAKASQDSGKFAFIMAYVQ